MNLGPIFLIISLVWDLAYIYIYIYIYICVCVCVNHWLSLIRVTECCLIGARPVFDIMLTYCPYYYLPSQRNFSETSIKISICSVQNVLDLSSEICPPFSIMCWMDSWGYVPIVTHHAPISTKGPLGMVKNLHIPLIWSFSTHQTNFCKIHIDSSFIMHPYWTKLIFPVDIYHP